MRRAGQKGSVSSPATSVTPPPDDPRGTVAVERDDRHAPARRRLRRGQLALAIQQRIESRLAGRVRNLEVRVFGDMVVLEGQCATYYTKQLAQHAALGILEDEHLENAILVDVPQ